MDRYVLILLTQNWPDRYKLVVESVLQRPIPEHHCWSDSLSKTVHAACLQLDEVATNHQPIQRFELDDSNWLDLKWIQIEATFLSSYRPIRCQSLEMLAECLHKLADLMPACGYTDVFWFSDASQVGNLSVYGALKRLFEWNNAFITISGSTDFTLSAESELFAASLGACISTMDQIVSQKVWPIWQGSVLISGSQRQVKLSGFRLCCFSSSSFNHQNCRHEDKPGNDKLQTRTSALLSNHMNFVAEVNRRDIPYFYHTRDIFLLSLLSNEKGSMRSINFLNRLITDSQLCYILQLDCSTSRRGSPHSATADEKCSSKSWNDLLLDNISMLKDCQFPAKRKGQFGCHRLLVYALPSALFIDKYNISDNVINSSQQHVIVAERLRYPWEIDGSISDEIAASADYDQLVCDTYSRQENLVSGQPQGVLAVGAGVKHCLTDLNKDLTIMPEWQMLVWSSGCKNGHKTPLAGLSPPIKPKAMVLDLSDFLKSFSSDGSAKIEPTDKVALKNARSRLRRYESIDARSGESVPWPECSNSTYHDIYYSIGNGEVLEQRCEQMRLQLGSLETLCYCSAPNTTMTSIFTRRRSSVNHACKLSDQSLGHPYSNTKRQRRWDTNKILDPHTCRNHEDRSPDKLDKDMDFEMEGMQPVVQSETSIIADDEKRTSKTVKSCVSSNKTPDGRKRKKLKFAEDDRVNEKSSAFMPEVSNPNYESDDTKTYRHTELDGDPEVTIKKRVSKSQDLKKKLQTAVTESLQEYGVHHVDSLFKPCLRRLANILKAFIRDIPSDLDVQEEIKKLAGNQVAQVVEFEKSVASRSQQNQESSQLSF